MTKIDLTKITTPFGLLDPETQAALLESGGPYEFYVGSDDGPEWAAIPPSWEKSMARDKAMIYRVKPAPFTPPSIDWSHVSGDFNWLAVDRDGRAWLSGEKPTMRSTYWSAPTRHYPANVFASFDPGTVDWRDSLIMRPGYEGD